MKKLLLMPITVILLSALCAAESYSIKVHENFETMEYEIVLNNNVVEVLPFSYFYGYQIHNDRIYFIDTGNSRISEYGRLLFYDVKKKEIIYTQIETGYAFFITKDFKIITSSLCAVETHNEIADVFNMNFPKGAPLDISIYELKNQTLIKTFRLDKYRPDLSKMYLYLWLEFELKDEYLIIRYGMSDTPLKIEVGKINICSFDFEGEN